MNRDFHTLVTNVEQCIALISQLKSGKNKTFKSEATRSEYLKLGRNLIETAVNTDTALFEVVQRTSRPSTFYKRIAALEYFLFEQMRLFSARLPSATDERIRNELSSNFGALSTKLTEYIEIRKIGLRGHRSARRSKRTALTGLPDHWRTLLCSQGANGKYALPLLVCALTGARPKELQYGVEISTRFCKERFQWLLQFTVKGAKVKPTQGQPTRVISYSNNSENPLILALLKKLDMRPEANFNRTIQIESAVNFSVEIRRIAKKLWPNHGHSVTAYCFRHQFAADTKAGFDSNSVSLGLGHLSSKTRRHYGTRRQASKGEQLKPISIRAERELRDILKIKSFNNNNDPGHCSPT